MTVILCCRVSFYVPLNNIKYLHEDSFTVTLCKYTHTRVQWKGKEKWDTTAKAAATGNKIKLLKLKIKAGTKKCKNAKMKWGFCWKGKIEIFSKMCYKMYPLAPTCYPFSLVFLFYSFCCCLSARMLAVTTVNLVLVNVKGTIKLL